MEINKTYVGVKYFKHKNDQLEILRVVNDKDPNSFKCIIERTDKRVRISKDELRENYIRLRPDGVIYFNIASVGDIQDVIIMLYRDKDIEESKSSPYIVCRQNITDLFANTIKPDYNNLIVGLAVSEESLPEKISMDTILACDNILSTTTVCIYMDDTLNDVLGMIKTKEFDNVLYNLFVDHIKYKYKDNMKDYINKSVVDGYSKSLRGLMEDNEFMYEFCHGYGIYPVTFEVSQEEVNDTALNLRHRLDISNIIMKNVIKTYVVEFSKDIDLNEIEMDYLLLRDIKNKMYVVLYVYNGNMRIPVEKIESPENIEKMSKIPGYSSYIKDLLQFNTKKYQY